MRNKEIDEFFISIGYKKNIVTGRYEKFYNDGRIKSFINCELAYSMRKSFLNDNDYKNELIHIL